ncbi:MAG: hypothetical protein AAF621_00290 [Pseudomonadota bacterium]
MRSMSRRIYHFVSFLCLSCTSLLAHADEIKFNAEKLYEVYDDEQIVGFLQNACEVAPKNITTDPGFVSATMPSILTEFSVEEEMARLDEAELNPEEKQKIQEFLEVAPRNSRFKPVQMPKANTRLSPGRMEVTLRDRGNEIDICSYVINVTADKESVAYPKFKVDLQKEGDKVYGLSVATETFVDETGKRFREPVAILNGKNIKLNAVYDNILSGENNLLLAATDSLGRRGVQHYVFQNNALGFLKGPMFLGMHTGLISSVWDWFSGEKKDPTYTVTGATEGCDCKLTCAESKPKLCNYTYPLISNPTVNKSGHYMTCDATPAISTAKTWQRSPLFNVENEIANEAVEVVEKCTITCTKEGAAQENCIDCCPTPVVKYQMSAKIGSLTAEVQYPPDQAVTIVQALAKGIINFEQASAAVAGSKSYTYKRGYKITGSATSSVGAGVSAEASLKDAKIGRTQSQNVGLTAGYEEYAEATYSGDGTAKTAPATSTVFVTGLQHAKECKASQQRSVTVEQRASAHGYSGLGKFGVFISFGLGYYASNALAITDMKDKAYVKRETISATCDVKPPVILPPAPAPRATPAPNPTPTPAPTGVNR